MGAYLRETKAVVAMVGVERGVANKLSSRLTLRGPDDPGEFIVREFPDLESTRLQLDPMGVTAICINLDAFPALEAVSFISGIRQSHPLIPFCLLGKEATLEKMDGIPEQWRDRFRHYFKFQTDVGNDHFDVRAGLVRDLFVADSIKVRALAKYETTPGVMAKLKNQIPPGTWVGFLGGVIAAVVGQFVAYGLRAPPAASSPQAVAAPPTAPTTPSLPPRSTPLVTPPSNGAGPQSPGPVAEPPRPLKGATAVSPPSRGARHRARDLQSTATGSN